MAFTHGFRRRSCGVLSLRTVVVAVPAVWFLIILWTVYNAQIVQKSDYTLRQREMQRWQYVKYGKVDLSTRVPDVDEEIEDDRRGDGNKDGGDDNEMKDEKEIVRPLKFIQEGQEPAEDDAQAEVDLHDFQDHHGDALFHQPHYWAARDHESDDHVEYTWREEGPPPKKKSIRPGMRFDPPKLGEFGKSVNFDPRYMNQEDRASFDEGWKNHQFNEFASLHISTQRATPDNRNDDCKKTQYGDLSRLPKVSVIICFYNEAWSVLLRSIHSVLSESPPELLEEIILVDDFSDMVTMQKPLEFYVAQVDKLRLLRMTKRSGLVRARLAGVRRAKAPVLLFLDSHIECATGWLTPLLKTISDRPNVAVTPEIDVIDHKTFAINAAIDNIGVLDFRSFSFDWSQILPRLQAKRTSGADLIESPTMAGGLFAIRKDYFLKLGTYDTDLELWGGENIELSLKLWMCGGGIVIHPCSRVAHIFRDQSPYLKGNHANVLNKNSARVAQVWADDYRKFYFKHEPYDEAHYGSVQSRLDLKESLQCRSFSWYVDNIYPELLVEGTGRYLGEIRHTLGRCLRTRDHNLYLGFCDQQTVWEKTRVNEIRTSGQCMDHSQHSNSALSSTCDLERSSQKLDYTQDKTIRHQMTGTCLTARKGTVIFSPCSGDLSQIWEWPENPDYMTSHTTDQIRS